MLAQPQSPISGISLRSSGKDWLPYSHFRPASHVPNYWASLYLSVTIFRDSPEIPANGYLANRHLIWTSLLSLGPCQGD